MWLIVFGCVEIGIGALALLSVPLTLVTAALSRAADVPGPQLSPRLILTLVGFYFLLGVAFAWIGIGTIKKRRWAQALMLSTSWLWLAFGVFGMAQWYFQILPAMTGLPGVPALGDSGDLAMRIVKAVLTVFMAFLYIVLPVAFVLFFRAPSVRATVEHYDPKPRWTDRCPGPVLSMVLTLAYGVVFFLFMLLWDFTPFFGVVLQGVPAALVLLVSAGLLVWITAGFYRLRREAWWGTLGFTAVWTVSSIVTFLRVPIEEIYQRAGFDADQVEALQSMGMGGTSYTLAATALSTVTIVAYLVYLWKYFRVSSPAT